MKEYEIGDVIPIYEVPMDTSFQIKGSSTLSQQVPINPEIGIPGLIEAHFVVFNKGTIDAHTDSALFHEPDCKPIGQMRIKKLK